MLDELRLCRLAGDDIGAYKMLRDAMLLAHPEAFTSDADTEAAAPADRYGARFGTPPLADGRFTLGAWRPSEVGNELVGAITCERDARVKVQHVAHIVGMMVATTVQGHGIGSRLLTACIAEARRVPELELLTLSVTAGNSAAIALYRRAGFDRYGSLPRAIKIGAAYHAKDLMVLNLRNDNRDDDKDDDRGDAP